MEFRFTVSTQDPERMLDLLYEAMDCSQLPGWDYNEDADVVHIDSTREVRLRPRCEQDCLHWEVVSPPTSEQPRGNVAHVIASFIAMLLAQYEAEIHEIVIC